MSPERPGDDRELWRAWRRGRDPALRDRLVERHLGVVKQAAAWVAGRLPSHLRLDDLYSAGMMGYLDAIEHYDPEVGVSFAAYAGPRIRGAILDELRRLDCVPRRVRRRIREAQRAIEALCQRLDRQPEEEEVARELGIPLAEYRRLLGAGVTLLSIDALAEREEGPTPLDVLEDPGLPSPLQRLEGRERRQLLAGLIDRLPPRERQVLALYYVEELTMQEIGQVLGVTESRVSQIHSGALLRLRAMLRRQRLEAGDFAVTPAAGRRGGGRGR